MFTERINTLLDMTGATLADIAAKAGFDRTNISKIKNGRRIPGPDSTTSLKLIEGIYLCFDNKNELKRLCDFIGADDKASAAEIKDRIRAWLYADHKEGNDRDSAETAAKKNKRPGQRAQTFGERLNTSMELAELSNARLSRLTHTDPSLISRYRNGVRTPVSNPALAGQISGIIYDYILKRGKENELSEVMGIPVSELEDEDFFLWLYDQGESQGDGISSAESLLGIFDSFTASSFASSSLPSVENIVLEPDNAAEAMYYGMDGLRAAVLRFLSGAVREKAAHMYLYSDEDQSWLTKDPAFTAKWAALMLSCVRNGTQIHIIHNVDRDLQEMNDAIKSWLPLYMSGQIEAFFCKKIRNSRFSHTFFLIPERSCIRAFGVSSSPADRVYHYYTEERTLNICKAEYTALLSSSAPLIKPLPAAAYPEVSDVIIVQNSLSIATMSRELAKSFDSPELLKIWEKAHSALLGKLERNLVCECIPLATKESLHAGAVSTSQALTGALEFTYSPEQYSMHIRCITDLLDKYSNYRFYPVPEPPFQNIDLLISDDLTRITPVIRPGLAFSFEEPSMCHAFKNYAGALMDKCKTDRKSLKESLQSLITG